MSELNLNRERTALLVMDFQTPIVERFATGQDALLAATASAIAAARQARMRVIYVVVGFRPGFPEISPRNKGFSAIKAAGGLASDIQAEVAPSGDEPIVVKHRVNAFMGTDLDMILRSNAIDTLVMCGIATGGVVLSTLRHAADADYHILVLGDCCSDLDPAIHACLLEKVFPRQATVTTCAAFVEAVAAD